MLNRIRRGAVASLTVLLATSGFAQARAGQSNDDRPKLVVTARPSVAIAPATVRLTAELTGGASDFEEFYCPTVIWDWDDGTVSESSTDCEPYAPGVSQIRRRFTIEHRFRAGSYRVVFRLKNRGKEVAATTVSLQIRPGGPG